MAKPVMENRNVIALVMFGGVLGIHCAESDDDPESEPPAEVAMWASFGHDLHNTRHNAMEDVITTETVDRLRVEWDIVGANVTSTPAVVDDVVYHADWTGLVHARKARNGEAIWSSAIPDSSVNASVVVAGDAVFVGDMTGILHRLDRETGGIEWSVELDDHPDANLHSSPVVVDDLVIIGVASGELGEIKEDFTFRGSVVALNKESGEEQWRVYMTTDDEEGGAGVSVWSSAAVDEERGWVFIGTGNTYEEPASPRSDAVVAIDYGSGEVQWVRQFTEGDVYTLFQTTPQGPDADIGGAPNLFSIDGRDVVGVGDKAGVYGVLDRDTGDVVWMRQLTEGSHLGGVMVAAAYAENTVFVVSNSWPGGFDTENIWIPDFQAEENSSTLFALNATNGDTRWEYELPHPTLGALAVAGGVVYTGTSDGHLRGFDARSGALLWEDQTGYSMASGQTIVDGTLYTGHGFDFIGLASGAPPGQQGGVKAYALPSQME